MIVCVCEREGDSSHHSNIWGHTGEELLCATVKDLELTFTLETEVQGLPVNDPHSYLYAGQLPVIKHRALLRYPKKFSTSIATSFYLISFKCLNSIS